jgi:hypothetical protein
VVAVLLLLHVLVMLVAMAASMAVGQQRRMGCWGWLELALLVLAMVSGPWCESKGWR